MPRLYHGYSKHPLYIVWRGMICRCHVRSDYKWPIYGGRGIKVCREWRDDPRPFIRWALANGWRRGLTIDRTKGWRGYSPGNCAFVTFSDNNKNRRPWKWSAHHRKAYNAAIRKRREARHARG